MSWINEHQRVWRAALLVLLLGAMMGPWSYDRVYVPAKYPCSAPNVRLEGDFCGVPLSGMSVFVWWASGVIAMITQSISGAVVLADHAREILAVGLGLLLLVAPFFSLLLLISSGGRRRWQVSHMAIWGLALGVVLLTTVFGYPRLVWELWGIWLYLGLAAGTLTLEALTLAAKRTADRK